MTTVETAPTRAVAPDAPTDVAVCILTYRRPQGLQRLLDALQTLDIPDGRAVRIVVVDNDAARSAEKLVQAAAMTATVPFRYVNEPARSISIARNRAVTEAGDVDFVAFIDDDEWPRPDWLAVLLASQRDTGADVVTGPVEPVFESPPPAWVTDGRFFERPRHRHDERIRYATTSNVLIRRTALDAVEGPFDPAFGMSGGEDTHLFAQMREAGCVLVWSDRAVVEELVPDSRVTTGWILRREYRRGQTLSLSLRARGAGRVRTVRRVINGAVQIGAGVAGAAVGLFRSRHHTVRGVHRMMFGAGMLTGLAGLRHLEYREVHGG
jgi:succinoglycan biosynthesis protein ExoM